MFMPISEFRNDIFHEYRQWKILSRDPVTHDVDHYILQPPKDIVSCFQFDQMARFFVQYLAIYNNWATIEY